MGAMPPPPPARIRRALDLVLVASAATFALAYVATALLRISYPFELEWMEGGMVDHVRRILEGKPIYAAPSLEFVSFLYPPLYYVAAAGFAKVLGLGFLPLRLLSLLSSVGVLALIFSTVRRETGQAVPAVVASGLFAAFYAVAGSWYDLARLDSFYLLLLLCGIRLLRSAASPPRAAAAGLLLAAAFFTKQSALVVFVPLAAYALLEDMRRGLAFSATGVATGLGGVALLNAMSGGWFSYYCFQIPARHPRLHGGSMAFWTTDVFPTLLPATAGTILLAAWTVRQGDERKRLFLPFLAAGMIASSWSVRSVVGAEVNNLLPALAGFAVVLGSGWGLLRAGGPEEGTSRRRAAEWATGALLVAQLALLVYDPRRLIPTPADRAAGERVVSRIAAISGDVFIPHHAYLARLAGKSGSAHTLAMDNVFLDDAGPRREELAGEMIGAMRARRYAAVVMENDGRYKEAILEGYAPSERLFDSPDVFWPVTGGRLRPEILCLPR